jgi:hypothetical protein
MLVVSATQEAGFLRIMLQALPRKKKRMRPFWKTKAKKRTGIMAKM